MQIIPIRQEYIFTIMKHTMRGVCDHKENARRLTYYFDQKLVLEKEISGNEFYTDDDVLREAAEDYTKSNQNVYSDILSHHAKSVSLSKKIIDFNIENNGLCFRTCVTITKDCYEIRMSTNFSEDEVHGKFYADNFSEVLEKIRLFASTINGLSQALSEKIDILSNDKIREVIDWKN